MAKNEQREFRRAVLNGEAPRTFIGPLTGTDSQQDEQMQIAWSKGWHSMADWFQTRRIDIDHWKKSDLPEDLAFYLDDEPLGPKSTTGSWSMNRHAGIAINGLRDKNVDMIQALMEFREQVGGFPTAAPKWWKSNDPTFSRTSAAFHDAWRPFMVERGAVYDSAALVYDKVKSGTFMDEEMQVLIGSNTPHK